MARIDGFSKRLGAGMLIDEDQIGQLLRDLADCLQRLEAIDARIAAAYLDSAIEALCHERQITRDTFKTD